MGNKERDLVRRGIRSGWKGVREISWKILNTVTKNSVLHARLPHNTPVTWSQIIWLFVIFCWCSKWRSHMSSHGIWWGKSEWKKSLFYAL